MNNDLFDSRHVKPMLIAEDTASFDDPEYIFETKWDGVRCIAFLDSAGTYLHNKRGKDLTPLFPELKNIHKQIGKRYILDGELAAIRNGRTVFQMVQKRCLMTNPFKITLSSTDTPATFIPFDILYYEDRQINLLPLMKRREYLVKAIQAESERMAISQYIEEKGTALYDAAAAQHLEGIVGKRRDCLYVFGKRTKDWVKCKALLEDDFFVAGYYDKGHMVNIVMAAYQEGNPKYCCHVLIGKRREEYRILCSLPEVNKESLYSSFPDYPDATWVQPEIVAVVRYMERTAGGGFRQTEFKGLRDDKTPLECTVEKLNPPHK